MNTQQQMEERLWDYIDGLSSPVERSAIEALIAANAEWRKKYQELLEVHQVMSSSDLEAPSMRFTKNVMEEIARHHVAPATKYYINKNIIRSIAAFFILMIVGFLVYSLGQFNWSASLQSKKQAVLRK
jgi:anti-sigma factor RsiW